MTINETFRAEEKGLILNKILEAKVAENRASQAMSISTRKRREPKSLARALKRKGPGFIFECKKASPALGDIRPNVNLDALVQIYEPFADAISVLTETSFFKGSLTDLLKVGEKTNLPILAKDFFLEEAQIRRAYAAGADAILLILSILDDQKYGRLANTAKKLGLEVVTEVHNLKEMDRANALGAQIIGINNRDLKTLKVDLATTKELAPLARKGSVLISESGFSGRSEILDISSLVDGFLIGGAVMGADRPDLKTRELVFGNIKICGLTTPQDAWAVFQMGAIYGGLNFVEETPRAIDLHQARSITRKLRMRWVGVFRNTTPNYIAAMAEKLNLSVVQLHGFETDKFREKLKALLPERIEIWQAIDGTKYNPRDLPKFCDRVLLDTKKRGVFGGTGQTFGWKRLKSLEEKSHLGLAGGVGISNIRSALKTGIPVIDVGSSIEEHPGVKSKSKMEALFGRIREFRSKPNA